MLLPEGFLVELKRERTRLMNKRKRRRHYVKNQAKILERRKERYWADGGETARAAGRAYYADNAEALREKSRLEYHADLEGNRKRSALRNWATWGVDFSPYPDGDTFYDCYYLYITHCERCDVELTFGTSKTLPTTRCLHHLHLEGLAGPWDGVVCFVCNNELSNNSIMS